MTADRPAPAGPVRLAADGDGRQLAALRWASRSDDERAREAFDRFAARFGAWFATASAGGAWRVAVADAADGTLAGCMYLHVVGTVPVPGVVDRAWGQVTHAFVAPPLRRLGIGTRLLDRLLAEARALRLHELHVWPSTPAVSLYVRAGFRSPESQRAAGDEPAHVLRLVSR